MITAAPVNTPTVAATLDKKFPSSSFAPFALPFVIRKAHVNSVFSFINKSKNFNSKNDIENAFAKISLDTGKTA